MASKMTSIGTNLDKENNTTSTTHTEGEICFIASRYVIKIPGLFRGPDY
jgi:hypothetical protein